MDEIELIAPGPPGFFSQDGTESLSMKFCPYGAIPFFLYHAKKKENCVVFFLNRLSFCIKLSPLDNSSINFNVINNNFCVADPFMLYMSYNLSASFISEQIIIN